MAITKDRATALAEGKVRDLSAENNDEFAIAQSDTQEHPEGWLFFYNSREYLETGDPMSALAGNGPLLVTRSGDVKQLSSATDWVSAQR